jgi:hypothetical protein
MAVANSIRAQVAVMVAEAEHNLGRESLQIATLATLESEVEAVAKTVVMLSQRARSMLDDQRTRVDELTAKHRALAEELVVIDRIIERLEAEVGK